MSRNIRLQTKLITPSETQENNDIRILKLFKCDLFSKQLQKRSFSKINKKKITTKSHSIEISSYTKIISPIPKEGKKLKNSTVKSLKKKFSFFNSPELSTLQSSKNASTKMSLRNIKNLIPKPKGRNKPCLTSDFSSMESKKTEKRNITTVKPSKVFKNSIPNKTSSNYENSKISRKSSETISDKVSNHFFVKTNSKDSKRSRISKSQNSSSQKDSSSYHQSYVSRYNSRDSFQNEKIKSIFFNITKRYELSNRFINDELPVDGEGVKNISRNKNNKEIVKDFSFIDSIRQKVDTIPHLTEDCLLRLSDKSIFNLLSFSFDFYSILLNHTNKAVSGRIKNTFNNLFSRAIEQFKIKVSSILKFNSFSFQQFSFRRSPKKTSSNFSLVLKSEITSERIKNKSVRFQISYKMKGQNYLETYSFDLNPDNDTVWLLSEYDPSKFRNRICYSQPVFPLLKGDFIEFYLPVFSSNGIIDPLSINFYPIELNNIAKMRVENSPFVNENGFDCQRGCEVETIVQYWKTVNRFKMEEGMKLVNEVKKVFGIHFEVKNVYYEKMKFVYYKFEMKAKSEGKILKNKFINFDIEIVGKDAHIIKEIHNLFTLNSNIYKRPFSVRCGKKLVLYLINPE